MSRSVIIEDPINRYQARVNSSGELLVAGAGGGGGGNVNLSEYGGVAVGAGNALHVQPGTGAVFAVSQDTSPWVVSGTVAVSAVGGTVAVTQSGTWSVEATQATHANLNATVRLQDGDGSGLLDVVLDGETYPGKGDTYGVVPMCRVIDGEDLLTDGTFHIPQLDLTGALRVTATGTMVATQATHANLNAQVRLQDRNGSDLLSVLKVDAAPTFPLDEYGILPLVLVTDSPFATGGTYTTPRMNEAGSIYVQVTGWTGLTIAGDFYSSQGGLPAMLRRQDTPASGASLNGQWTYGISDSTGKLWVNVGNSTLAVTQSTSPWVVSGTVAVSAVGGTVAVTQSGPWDIANITTSVTPGVGSAHLGKESDAPFSSGDTGVMSLGYAVRSGGFSDIVDSDGDYMPFVVARDTGGLFVHLVSQETVIDVQGTVSITGLLKSEDAVAANGDTGVMVLAVRQDTLSSSVSANGDYGTFKLDSLGRLWVRNNDFNTQELSASAHGRPIQITATASTGTTLHVCSTTVRDRIFLDLTNTSTTVSVTVTIEFGTTGAASQIKVVIPPNDTIRALDGVILGGNATTDTVRAFASTASVVNAVGRIERLLA